MTPTGEGQQAGAPGLQELQHELEPQLVQPDAIDPRLDVEAAVASAMASTEGLPASASVPRPDARALRPIGRHMLGLLGSPEATEQQRRGARLILLAGTPAERQMLFLHDAMWVAGQPAQQQQNGGALAQAARVALPQMGSVRAMAERGEGGRSVQALQRRLDRGQEVSSEAFQRVVTEVRDRLLPTLHPDDLVSYLRMQRYMPANQVMLGDGAAMTRMLTVLIEKGRQIDPRAPEGRAVIAEAAIALAQRLDHAAYAVEDNGGFLAARRAEKMHQTASRDTVAAFNLLPDDMRAFCTGYDASIDTLRLSRFIDASEMGMSYAGLSGVLLVEPDFLQARRYAASGDMAWLNTVGEMVAQGGPSADLVYRLRTGWILGERQAELQIAAQLSGREALAGIMRNSGAAAHLVNILKGYDPEEQERTLALLEVIGNTANPDAVILLLQSTGQFEAFKSMLTYAETGQTFGQVHALLSVPNFAVSMHGPSGGLGGEREADQFRALIDSANMELRANLIAWLDAAGVNQLTDPYLAMRIMSHYTQAAFTLSARPHDQPGGASAEDYLASARQLGEMLAFPGTQEALAQLRQKNGVVLEIVLPALLEGDGSDLLQRAQTLSELAHLSTEALAGVEPGIVVRSIPEGVDTLEGVLQYVRFGMADLIGPQAGLASQADRILRWALDPASGDMQTKRVFLTDRTMRDFAAFGLKQGGEVAAGFVAQIERSKTVDEIRDYMNDCLALGRDGSIQNEVHNMSSTTGGRSFSSGDLWREVWLADSPREAMQRLRDLEASAPDLLTSLANQSPDAMHGMLHNYIGHENPGQYIEEWRAIARDTHILTLIEAQGLHGALRGQVLRALLSSDSPLVEAQTFERQLVGERPQWLINYELSRLLVESEGRQGGMIVREVPTGLPIGSRRLTARELDVLLEGELLKPIAEMSVDEKRLFLGGVGLADDELARLEAVPFASLDADAQQTLLVYRMFETLEKSRNRRQLDIATERNVAAVMVGERVWGDGDLVHFTLLPNMRSIMVSGNMAGEVREASRIGVDNYPFNVDFWRVGSRLMGLGSDEQRFAALPKGSFGDIALHYRRPPGGFRAGEEFNSGQPYDVADHYLLFAGMPSTELSAITVTDVADVAQLQRTQVEMGLYVPIYNPAGVLQFTPQQYFTMRADRNYDNTSVAIIDSAFVLAESRQGSSDGSEIYLPSSGSAPERWYAKFVDDTDEHSADRLWSEMLTDGIYATVQPDLVPETRVAMVNGRLARISRMVDEQEAVTDEARNAGFVLDCFTANWDAVFNADNLVGYQGRGLRVDNGGTLDFGPSSGKKADGSFTGEVLELRVGTNDTALGQGMRQRYPGLTDASLKQQAEVLGAAMTDDVIDRLVDGVRRTRADRDMLKSTLKARRDYIVSYADAL